jgi:Asp-tRNA(Asn)/Glu-tRNA(Gln) amidotransferase A subunit family amidase
LRIGFLIGFDALPMSATEIAGYNAAIAALRTLGHDLTHVDATSWDLVSSYRATFTLCELELARANRDRLRESPTDFSPELRTMLEYGASQSGQRLGLFEARLAALQARLLETFRGIDMLLTPTVPDVRVPHDAPEPLHAASFTNLASASGRPAVALPVAATSGGPPASVQLIGQPGDDYVLLSLAQSLEAAMS